MSDWSRVMEKDLSLSLSLVVSKAGKKKKD